MVWGTEQTNPSSDAGGNAGAAPAMQELLLHCFLSTFLSEKHPPGAMQEQVLHCPTLLLHCLLLCLRGQETSRFASPAQAEHRCRSWVCGFVRPTTRPVAATNHQFRVRAATRRRTLYLPQRLCSRLMRPRFAAPPHIFSAPQQRSSDLGLGGRQTDLDRSGSSPGGASDQKQPTTSKATRIENMSQRQTQLQARKSQGNLNATNEDTAQPRSRVARVSGGCGG